VHQLVKKKTLMMGFQFFPPSEISSPTRSNIEVNFTFLFPLSI